MRRVSAGAPVAVLATLSLRYWRRRLGRAVASVLGVALGVALVVSVIAVNQAVLRTYAGWVDALSGGRHVEVRAVETGGVAIGLLETVLAAPGVAAAGGVVEQRSYLFTEVSQAAVVVRGIDVAVVPGIRPVRTSTGRPLEVGDDTGTVLSAATAAELGVGVGESVSLLSAEGMLELHVVGVYGSLEVGGLARDRTAIVSLDTAQDAFMHGRDVITQIDVLPADAGKLDSLQTTLAALVEPQALVRLPADELQELSAATRGLRSLLLLAGVMALVAAVFLIGNNLAAGVEERDRDLGVVRALGLTRRVGAAWFLAEAAVMGALGSVVGAIVGAVGAGTLLARLPVDFVAPVGGVRASVGIETGAAAAGACVGLLVTLLVALPLALRAARRPATLASELARRARAAPARGAGCARRSASAVPTLALLVALLVAAPTALTIWRWMQLDAGQTSAGTVQATVVMLSMLLLSVALLRSLPVMFGSLSDGVRALATAPLWLRLATDSLRRHARRTGATAVSLSITLASLIGVYGAADSYRYSLEAWLDAAVTWDLLVTSGPQSGVAVQPLPGSAVDRLAKVPGVTAVLPERAVTVSAGGRAVELVAFDATADRPSRRLRAVEVAPGVASPDNDNIASSAGAGPASGESLTEALVDDGGIALSLALAARLGVSSGDEVSLATPTGNRSFSVLALVEDRAAEAPGAYLHSAVYARAFGDTMVDEIGVRLAADATAARTIAAMANALYGLLGERYPVQVVSAAAFRQEVLDGVGAAFAVVRALVLLAVMVAVAGLLNAMLIGFWQLRQQFSLLRALGAPAMMLVRTLATEALLTTLAGAAAGVLLGTLLSVALLRGLEPATGPLLTWSPPLEAYLTVAQLLLLAGLLGGSLLLARARSTPVAAVARGD